MVIFFINIIFENFLWTSKDKIKNLFPPQKKFLHLAYMHAWSYIDIF